jgi:hypothetical protein
MDNPNRMKAHFITESEINKPVATMISSERGVHFELSELAPQPQGAVSHRTSVKPEDVPALPPKERIDTSAFFETLGLHDKLAEAMNQHGVRSLRDLAQAESVSSAALDAAVQDCAGVIRALLRERLPKLQFTCPRDDSGKTGNRRDFMVALTEKVGYPVADEDEAAVCMRLQVEKLFRDNKGQIIDSEGDRARKIQGTSHKCPQEFRAYARSVPFDGLDEEDNLLMHLFQHAAKPLAKSVQECSPDYACILHRGYSVLATRGAQASVAHDLYQPLRDFPSSLCQQDGGWAHVLEPDETGFRGFTSLAPTSLQSWPGRYWTEEGFSFGGNVIGSPVVRVKSGAADDRGLHTAIQLSRVGAISTYMLPPLVLFKVVGVQDSFRMCGNGHSSVALTPSFTPSAGATTDVALQSPDWSPNLYHALGYDEQDGLAMAAAPAHVRSANELREWLAGAPTAVRGKVVLFELPECPECEWRAVAQDVARPLAHAGAAAVLVVVPAAPPETVVLSGTCAGRNHQLLGRYTLVAEQESGGRPVYRKSDEATFMYFFGGKWFLGDGSSVGKQGTGSMNVSDSALYPSHVDAHVPWKEDNGSGWVDAAITVTAVQTTISTPASHLRASTSGRMTTIPVAFVRPLVVQSLRAAAAAQQQMLRWPCITVRQQLITVQPTYLLTQRTQSGDGAAVKMLQPATTLSYGGRVDFGRGHAEITAKPVLTMEQEFQRDDRWVDGNGTGDFWQCSALTEWMYAAHELARVGGPVADANLPSWNPLRDCGGNAGMSASDFAKKANVFILKQLQRRRAESVAAAAPTVAAGHPAPQDRLQTDGHLLLVLEEVIAIRLYSGPAYVPLNKFLREVSKLSADWRSKLAQDPKHTYSATVGWLISGIRKLARVTELSTLYRGVRGVLPDAFGVPDLQGLCSATDFGFMSTSRDLGVTLVFMNKGQDNVLWELECRSEDEAHHNGADIAIISQFPDEKEVLFPPLTMMVAATPNEPLRVSDEERDGKQYRKIRVVPYYI